MKEDAGLLFGKWNEERRSDASHSVLLYFTICYPLTNWGVYYRNHTCMGSIPTERAI